MTKREHDIWLMALEIELMGIKASRWIKQSQVTGTRRWNNMTKSDIPPMHARALVKTVVLSSEPVPAA